MLCESYRMQVSIGLLLCKIMPPCNKAKVVMSYEIMDWPPQSPDLNPIKKSLEDLRSESYGKKSY